MSSVVCNTHTETCTHILYSTHTHTHRDFLFYFYKKAEEMRHRGEREGWRKGGKRTILKSQTLHIGRPKIETPFVHGWSRMPRNFVDSLIYYWGERSVGKVLVGHGDLSSISGTLVQSPTVVMPDCNPSTREAEKGR